MTERIAEIVGRLLRDRRLTLAVAESCTGGLIGHRITDVPGSSDYFLGGVISYSNTAKVALLGVSPATLRKYGAVSRQTAAEMAEGARLAFGADIALSATGIAGPSGGSRRKPVGLVYVGLAYGCGTVVRRILLKGVRWTVKSQAADAALEMAREHLDRRRRATRETNRAERAVRRRRERG